VTWKALNFRRQHQELFDKGDYVPLTLTDRHTVAAAFARHWQSEWVLIVVPLALAANRQQDQPYIDEHDDRRSIVLPESAPGEWINVFTGRVVTAEGRLSLFDAFRDFPVALFTNK
jgi:(1->4)-alpha-D-glucan 1-alpha-D-glucosylmutase